MRELGNTSRGYTLIELMVTVSVAAIILGLALPSFSQFVERTRVAAATSDFVYLLSYGRSEAIKRGRRVVVCRSADGTSCNGGNWSAGAVAFVDRDGDNAIDAGEEILRTLGAFPDSLTLTASADLAQRIVFLPAGEVLSNGEIALVGGDDDKRKRCLRVSNSGRVEAHKFSSGCAGV